jgi:hypothetical protein
MNKINQMAPWFPCLKCRHPIYVREHYMLEYFNGIKIQCEECKEHHCWWDLVKNGITQNFMFSQAFAAIGANSSIIEFHLKPNEQTIFKFSEQGIPETAKILHVNYTPQGGGFFPIEVHGNDATRKQRHDQVVVWPMPIGDKQEELTKVCAFVTWVEHSNIDASWKSMISAFEAFSSNDLEASIVPANVAVESVVTPFLFEYINQFVGKSRVEAFLDDAATYGHQLNVLLPLITSMLGLPKLDDHIRGALNKLRGYRNEVAHQGAPEKALTKEEVAEMLSASLFAFYYIKYIRATLEQG